MQGHEVGKGSDGLGGDTLIVLRPFGLFGIGNSRFVECFGAPFLIGIAVSSTLVRLRCRGKVGHGYKQNLLLLVSRSDVELRRGGPVAMGTVLNNLVIQFDGL